MPRRPISWTLIALAIGGFALLVAFSGVAIGFAGGFCIKPKPWVGTSLLLTAMLGGWAAQRIWRQHPGSAPAVLVFTAIFALHLLATLIDPHVSAEWLRLAGLGTAAFIAIGLFTARTVRQASLEPPRGSATHRPATGRTDNDSSQL